MSRRAATITQADLARTIRAAKKAGAPVVEVRPDGSMIVHLQWTGAPQPDALSGGVEPREDFVL